MFFTPLSLCSTLASALIYTMLTAALLKSFHSHYLSPLPSYELCSTIFTFLKQPHSQLFFLDFCHSQDSKLNTQNEKLKTRINIWGKIRGACFPVPITSIKTFLSVFINLTGEFIISHSFTDEFNSTVYMCYIFIICQLMEHVGWFYFLVIVNRIAMEPINSSTKKSCR